MTGTPLRIGIYTPNYPGVTGEGGIGSYTRTLASGLATLGHEIDVFTPGTGAPIQEGSVAVRQVDARYFPIVDRFLPGAGASWRIAAALRAAERARPFDLVEFCNWEGLGLLRQWRSRAPTVVRLHTSSQETQLIDGVGGARRERWDVRREGWMARRAHALVTHSQAHRQAMADELRVAPERILVIPHGVDVFPEWRRPPRPPGPPTVAYLGRMERRKGTVELLQAVPEVLKRVPDARFVLAGADRAHCPGGRTHARYLEEEFPPEVRRQVTLAGRLPQPDVDRLLQTSDVFAAPSLYESFGLVFLEAMRWGTPVVGTVAGGIPEIVEHGKSGILVPAESSQALAAALVELLLSPERRAELGAACRARTEQEFSVARMCGRVAELYAETIARRQAGRQAHA